jgi:hypothetical protein
MDAPPLRARGHTGGLGGACSFLSYAALLLGRNWDGDERGHKINLGGVQRATG